MKKMLLFFCMISGCLVGMNSTENRQRMMDLGLYQEIKFKLHEMRNEAIVTRNNNIVIAINSFKVESFGQLYFIHKGPRVVYFLHKYGLSDAAGNIYSEYARVWRNYYQLN